MCHRANKPPILHDGAAAHPLHHAAGLREQLFIRHAQQEVSRRV